MAPFPSVEGTAVPTVVSRRHVLIRRLVARTASRCAMLVVVALLAGGCNSVSAPIVCTQVACADGLMIRFDAPPPSSGALVELFPEELTGPRYVVECVDRAHCTDGVRFTGFTGNYALVRITTSQGTVMHEIRPTYVEHRPNGPDCPPVCRAGLVTVPLPG